MAERKTYLDYLRVLSSVFIVLIHVSAQNWSSTAPDSFEWQVFNFFDALSRWAVPSFIMISGALMLGRDIPVRQIYSKYVVRMAVAFIFWSTVYMLALGKEKITLITGHYHMWFVLMISGLYICLPLFERIVRDKKALRYYLIISFAAGITLPWLKQIANDFFGMTALARISNALYDNVKAMRLDFIIGCQFYFMLGYYLDTTELGKKQRCAIYILGLLGAMFTVIASSYISIKLGSAKENYYNVFSVNVFFVAVAVFTAFKYMRFPHERLNRLFIKLGKDSFGTYLVHILILNTVGQRFGINTLSFSPVISVLSITAVVCVVSYAISAIANRIPVLNKYIV